MKAPTQWLIQIFFIEGAMQEKIFFYPSTDNYKNHKGGMSNFRVVSRGIKKIVTNHYHDSWPMPYGYGAMKAYVSTANLFCKIFVTNISGRLNLVSLCIQVAVIVR
jgi:hypothetical protein